jgi:two-component system response regulator FlrC
MRLLTSRCRPGERIPALSADAAHLLLTYPWPGNVRELDNVMQRALILASGPVIHAEHMQMEGAMLGAGVNNGAGVAAHAGAAPVPASSPKSQDLSSSVSQTERDTILEALRSDKGNRQLAAKRLGISPRTLRYKLARLRSAGVEI